MPLLAVRQRDILKITNHTKKLKQNFHTALLQFMGNDMNANSKLQQISTFAELRTFVDTIRNEDCRTNFLACRYVTISNYKGKLTLGDLTRRVIQLVKNNWDLSANERKNGRAAMNRILNFYMITNKQLDNSNIITKIIWLFESLFGLYKEPIINKHFFVSEHDIFNLRTESQFKKAFNIS